MLRPSFSQCFATPTRPFGHPPHKGEGLASRQRRPPEIVRRVEALGSFLDTEDGRNLLAGTKRAANILAAEEKKKTTIADLVDPALFRTRMREALYAAVNQAETQAGASDSGRGFFRAMRRSACCVNRSIHSSSMCW